MILNAWNRFRGLHHEAAAREYKEMASKMEEEISSLYANIEVAGKVADKLWLLEIENRKLKRSSDELADAKSRAELAGKTVGRYRRELASAYAKLEQLDRFLHNSSKAWKKELESARSRIGAKTRAVNKLAARAESNKSHLGRFYWPATAYCEAALPCI